MSLSDFAARHAKPRDASYKLTDAAGLSLIVRPSGSKSWGFRYRFAGSDKTLTIGRYPEVTLAKAREARDDARDLLRDGIDPAENRGADERKRVLAAASTFEAVAAAFIAKRKKANPDSPVKKGAWSEKTKLQAQKRLNHYVLPWLGKRPVAEIAPPEVLALIEKIEARDRRETAHRVLTMIGQIMRYAVITGRAASDPTRDLRGALEQVETKHYHALAESDLPEFFRKLDGFDGHPLTSAAIRLLVLTAVRTGELRKADWSEFDLDGEEPTWRIPGARMKMKQPHIVPLSRQAVVILRELHRISGDSGLVFPNTRSRADPMTENTVLFALYRMGYHGRATGHGFRATFSTILHEQGFNPDWIERQLAHGDRSKVRAAYHRSAYLADRRRMMQAWADYLDGIAAGAKVTPIRRAKGAR
jgi:integrase